ncbi:MAG: M28 family peptidase [Phycisphaerae bacterium]|nr:M28 family peptidase [Phycisphaerae bacterium]
MKWTHLAICAAVALSARVAAQPEPQPVVPAPPKSSGTEARSDSLAAHADSPIAGLLEALGDDGKEFNAHVVTLSNPFFEGRAPGTFGGRLAADYIEHYHRRFKLLPAFAAETRAADGAAVVTPRSSYRQAFPFGTNLVVRSQRVEIASSTGGASVRALVPGADFSVLGLSGDGKVDAPLVFVGYSIPEGPDGYATFSQSDSLAGSVALVLRFEPMNEAGQSKWAAAEGNPTGWSARAGLEPKLRAAAERGAAAIVLVNPPGVNDPRAGTLEDVNSVRAVRDDLRVPVVMLSTDAADALVRQADDAGRGLMDLRRIADERGGVIELKKARLAVETGIDRIPVLADNVGAILPGKGALADRYIILGAHYDHLGFGTQPGSRHPSPRQHLHPGADDNASGTSGVLVLARDLAARYAAAPADASLRSVVFLSFSAEESGLVGSRFFVQHLPPTVTKDRIDLMINLDMIGRLKEGRMEVGGVGTAEGLADLVTPLFQGSGLTIKASPGGMGPSDHASFYAAGIPVLFFFTGLHEDYHMPSDEGWTINQSGAVRIIDLVRAVTLAAAARPEPLRFIESAGASAASGDSPGPTRSRVRFGIAPGDYSGSEPGVLVGDVFPNTSAADAGLKKGDLMTRWNGKVIKGVEEWMPLLAGHKPGDEVEISYLRDGREQTTRCVLKGRTSGDR